LVRDVVVGRGAAAAVVAAIMAGSIALWIGVPCYVRSR
jgi:hypothetical protein